MRVGDIVNVTDGSWCMFYGGDGGLRHTSTSDLRKRRWKVLASNFDFPASCCGKAPAEEVNDLMLYELDHPWNILFTRKRFCVPASETPKQPEPARVTVPAGTKELVITFADPRRSTRQKYARLSE